MQHQKNQQTRGVHMDELRQFCERLPQEACIFTARIGDGQQLSIVFRGVLSYAIENGYEPTEKDTIVTMVYENIDDLIDECTEIVKDEGYGLEYSTMRFQAYTIDRKPIRSKVIRTNIEQDFIDENINSITALTNANIRMSEEIRRVLREVSNNNAEHLKTIGQLTSAFVQSKKEMLELERENMVKELVMSLPDDDDDTKSKGLDLLERVVGGFFQQQQTNIDDMVKETIKNDPSKVREYCEDPEIVEAIRKAMFGGDNE